jgi:ribonuclease HII
MLNSGEYIIKERDAWNEVLGIDGSKSLSSEDRSRLYRAITLVRSLESSRRQANSIIDASAAELRLDPSFRSLPKGRSIDDLCQPLWR